MESKNHLILGAGEIGKSLKTVLDKTYDTDIVDRNQEAEKQRYEVLHVCYPYSDEFIHITNKYIEKYNPELVIIHSTVKVGTTKKLPTICVHSPVRGKHPNLADSIETFVKFVGGEDAKVVDIAIETLVEAGITCYRCYDSKTSELLKILSTTRYGWEIVFMKEVKKLCDEAGVSFLDVYTVSNQTYNDGYEEMGDDKFHRSLLTYMEGKIGGHCVIPNCRLIEDWDLAKFILDKDETY